MFSSFHQSAGPFCHYDVRVLLHPRQHTRHWAFNLLGCFEQVIGYGVRRVTPENSIPFYVQLKREFGVLSIGDVLGHVLEDDVVDQFAHELVVVESVSLVLLRFVDYVVINNSGLQMELGLHHFGVASNLDELPQRQPLALANWELSKLDSASIPGAHQRSCWREDVEGGLRCPHESACREF